MKSILEYLENSAERFPGKCAFADENRSCSFLELKEAGQKAGSVLAQKRCLRKPVVLLMEKSVRTIQIMMGVVYAGGFYVILDAAQPVERLNRILDTLDAKILVTASEHEEYAHKLRFSGEILREEDLGKGEIDNEALEEISCCQKDVDPLYVLFTSGSTGTPKGVVVAHRSVIDFIDVFTKTFAITEEDVLGNQAPLDFDVSVKDIYSGLKTGASVQLIPKQYFSIPMRLLDFLEERKVTNLTWAVSALTVLSLMNGLSYKVPPDIRRIMFSGETMPIRHLNYWRQYYPDVLFVNLYGPTEITCNCTYYKIDRPFETGQTIPIGKPFPNETVFLLDEEDHLVTEPDVNGEICVSGTALAMGYYHNPEQTQKAFVQNPLNKNYQEMIYRTGDLGYYDGAGELCFASRKDFQIKHMGHRIELGEIESALEKVEQIRRSCCLFDEKRNKIVCCYQGNIGKKEVSIEAGKYLPGYMVPNIFRQMDELPITKNGKIDRNGLKALLEK